MERPHHGADSSSIRPLKSQLSLLDDQVYLASGEVRFPHVIISDVPARYPSLEVDSGCSYVTPVAIQQHIQPFSVFGKSEVADRYNL